MHLLCAQQMPEQSSKDERQGWYRQQVFGDTLMCCYRRTHWGWLMTLACSGLLILPATICGGLVLGMQARPASTGTESSSSSTRTSLQPMTSCQMTSRWTHTHTLNVCPTMLQLPLPFCQALRGHAHTARHGWSCYVLHVMRVSVPSKLHDNFWRVA